MCDTYGRVGRIDALAARAGRTKGVDAQVFRVDMDVDFIHLRHNGNGHGGSADAAAGFRRRDTLHPMRARLVLKEAVGALALDQHDDFFVSADPGFRGFDKFRA